MRSAKIVLLLLGLASNAVQAQTVAPPAARPPAATTLAAPAPQIPATEAVREPAPQPAPPVAAPFGALYNTISGRTGNANCTPGLTPYNTSACR